MTPDDMANTPRVEVRRSARRRRTVAAYRDGDTVVVLIPARFSAAEEQAWVTKMVDRLRQRRRRRYRSDDDLIRRAHDLVERYFPVPVSPTSVRWVGNQRSRWGSCTPADGTIRLSERLLGLPDWVIDYVLIHELAHLHEPNHTPKFWELVDNYPSAQRARGFLEGLAAARSAGAG